MRYLSRLAHLFAAGSHPLSRNVGRVPREVVECLGRMVCDLELSVAPRAIALGAMREAFGISDAAVRPDQTTTRFWAYAFHAQSRMVLRVERCITEDIFTEELRAIVEGVTELDRQDAGAHLRWLSDNLRALYVLKRGWTVEWAANSLVDRWASSPSGAAASCSYIPSALNVMDGFTRHFPGPVVKTAAPCAEHPGRDCPEFWNFVRSALPADETARVNACKRVNWSMSDTVAVFHDLQPAQALAHLR